MGCTPLRAGESHSRGALWQEVSFLGVKGVTWCLNGAEGGQAVGWIFEDVWMEGGSQGQDSRYQISLRRVVGR